MRKLDTIQKKNNFNIVYVRAFRGVLGTNNK